MNTTSIRTFEERDLIQSSLPRIFDHLDLAVVVCTPDGKIVSANDHTESVFGFHPEELIDSHTSMLFTVYDTPPTGSGNPAVACMPEQIRRCVNKAGHTFEAECHGGPICGSDGRVLFQIYLIQDVSVRLSATRTLNALHGITSSRELSFDQRVDAILRLGIRHFGLPIGIFSHIEGDLYTVVHAIHPEDGIAKGTTFDLGVTYCSHVYEANGPQGFHHVGESRIKTHPCYHSFELEAYLGTPIFVDGERYGTLNFSSPIPTRPFTEQDIELIKLFSEWLGHELARKRDMESLENARRALEKLAATDSLTGLINRRTMEDWLQKEIQKADRYRSTLSIAMLDVDHFKAINDQFGHSAGDQALLALARVCKQEIRGSDAVARWGGEEFLIVFPQTDAPHAQAVVERICSCLGKASGIADVESCPITVSVGLVQRQPGEQVHRLIARADRAMYRAKAAGRNQVVSDPPGHNPDQAE